MKGKTGDQYVTEIQSLLSDIYTPNEADTWWSEPHPQFDGKSALEMVETGRGDEVVACLKRLNECAYL